MVGQMVGQKLAGRYRLLKQLGQGGFGQAFLAEDEHLPDEYQCVVKRFHMGEAQQEDTLQTAKRLFDAEAKALHRLGHHEQLPKLLAHFEDEGEFYLVEEYIPGPGLDNELKPGEPKTEEDVIELLQDLLGVLSFVHQKQVIHRDIKPSNIIRRDADGRLVLIDFGAVKQVTTQMVGGTVRPHTVVIGTPGYMPSEQFRGSPKPSSDVYAVGMIGIQAITGLNPSMGELPEDDTTGEIQWQENAEVSPGLAEVLSKMVLYDFRHRYRTAQDALDALNAVTMPATEAVEPPLEEDVADSLDVSEVGLPVAEVSSPEPMPATEVSIPMPEAAADLPETQVQLSHDSQEAPLAADRPAEDVSFNDVSPGGNELPVVGDVETTVQPLIDDATTELKSPEAVPVTEQQTFKSRKPIKLLIGGGVAIAASGLFALVGAPHMEGICSALGNCTAAVKARTDLASALSILETSDEKLSNASSIEELESLHTEMGDALKTVQSIGSNNSLAIADEAQTSADDYQKKHDALSQRLTQEKDSKKHFDSAIAKAQTANTEKAKAETVAAKDDNIKKWQAAVDDLTKIKEPAFVYATAQEKKKNYEAIIKNLNASIDTILAEERAWREQQAAARQAEQRRQNTQAPAYNPPPSYASSGGSSQAPAYNPAPAPAPVYQEPAYNPPPPAPAPAPAPAPSYQEPLWGGSGDPQSEPLW